MSSAPIVDRIRIIPRPQDFLDRNIGASGEVFFNKATNSLRVYSGGDVSGFEIARADLNNISNADFLAKATSAGVGDGGSGSSTFVDLTDTPESFASQAGKILAVNDTEDGLEFIAAQSGTGFSEINLGDSSSILAENGTSVTLKDGPGIEISTDTETNTITISALPVSVDAANQNLFLTVTGDNDQTITASSPTSQLIFSGSSGITCNPDANTNTVHIQYTGTTSFDELSDAVTAGNLTIDKVYEPAIAMMRIDNVGTSAYTFNSHYSGNNPTIYALAGTTIAFDLDAIPGHPFEVQDPTGTAYNTGLVHVSSTGTVSTGSEAQGKSSGTLYWRVPESISGNYRYQCQSHAAMVGQIVVKRLSVI